MDAETQTGKVAVEWILTGGAGATVGFLAKMIFDWVNGGRRRNVEVSPQPLEVRTAEKYQTVAQCDKVNDLNMKAHENMFLRLSALEKHVGIVEGKVDTVTRLLENQINVIGKLLKVK